MFVAGVPFPKNFLTIAKTILKRLFRVYAHLYHQHFSEVMQLGEEAHLNTSFKHFIFFVQVYIILSLISPLQTTWQTSFLMPYFNKNLTCLLFISSFDNFVEKHF